MNYLLDTNIPSSIMTDRAGPAALRLHAVGESGSHEILTSIIVVCELRFGIEKKGSDRLRQRLEEALSKVSILPFASDADAHYSHIRADLERRGPLIGPNDLLIAAHALALDTVLVTDNVGEFARVKGLRVENWL